MLNLFGWSGLWLTSDWNTLAIDYFDRLDYQYNQIRAFVEIVEFCFPSSENGLYIN